ncbi:Serine-aspartate repeat-containing protein F precursor [Roseimaritima multifibrata]|uniref:Serine-aspartate repeat-containing protein F n=1 Tax=Roseimaritima multifibrata TaxID=1930274 RepID=A0A517MIZ2_9BACT|nr:SdrD B-like domain-containing protein [Roseimaritima multifibrata]QDS94853.1 Serine-aspartate repeat-containing protein F precursor [Roseimaritima multifibrata]
MVFSQLFNFRRSQARPKTGQRRRLKLERLANRELLAADIGVITGTVYTDLANNDSIDSIVNTSGATVNDPTLDNVVVRLYNDNDGNGILDTGAGDTLEGTFTTGADGVFRFDNLSAGDYLLDQDPVAGLISPAAAVPVVVVDADGQTLVSIDDFTTGAQSLTVASSADPDATDSASGANILGGERDLKLINQVGADSATLSISAQLNYATELGVVAQAVVQYDGVDGSENLDATGLGSVSLDQAEQGAGVVLGAFADLAGGEVNVVIYTDANNASEATISIPVSAVIEEIFVPFDTFTTLGGATGPADFSDVGAIEAIIQGVASMDSRVSVIKSLAPVEVEQNLVNFDPVSVGGTVFRDTDNDGMKGGSEPGIVGVDINLYQDTDNSGDLDTNVDTFIGTTVTIAGGNYVFTDLVPGEYLIQIPASEFTAGQPLFGSVASTGLNPVPDPDDDVDSDNNGSDVDGLGIVSSAITLVSLGEPIDDGDVDPNTNLTVDFGVVAETDLAIEKELMTQGPTAGEEAVFRITVRNNGDSVANNVEILDAIPAGLTYNRVENVTAGVNVSVSGTTVTATVASMAINEEVTFDIVVDIPSSTTGTAIINEATVTSDELESDTSNNSDTATVPIAIVTDLRLEKSASLATVASGGALTYTLTVTNDGPSDATGVVVTDTLPGDVTFNAGSVNGNAALVSEAGGVVTATVGNIASGASQTITIVVDVASNAGATLTNTATVTNSPDTDDNTANDTDSVDVAVERQVDVEITKTVSASPLAGGTATFTFVVENKGPGDARGITVTDTLASEFTFSSLNAGTSGATLTSVAGSPDLEFALGTIAANGTATFTIDVLIDASVTSGASISNTAVVDTTDTDTDPDNNTSTIPVVVTRQVDLHVEKDDNVTNGIPGQPIQYTITVTNNGVSDASGVQIVDTLPAELTVTAIDADGANFVNANGVITFNIGDLAVDGSRTVTITGTIDDSATGDLTNDVTVDSTEPDADTIDNSDQVVTPLTPEFDLLLTKTGPATITPGQDLTYTIVVSNTNGPSDATGVTVVDTLPAGTTFVSGLVNGVAPTVNGDQITFDFGTVAANGARTATLTVRTDAASTGTLTNTAVATADPGETNADNNTDDAVTTLVPDVDLTVAKTVSDTTAEVGDSLTYTIVVSNLGGSTATGVEATDTLPGNFVFTSGTGPNGADLSVNGNEVDVTIGTLAAGATATFTITGTISANASGVLTNSVTVETPLTETSTTNNSATATTTIDNLGASISGAVFEDLDGDKIQDDDELGIPNVRITLTGTDVLGNPVTEVTTTNAQGKYSFENLRAGTYQVTETQPTDRTDGGQVLGTVNSNTTGTIPEVDVFELSLGPNEQAIDFIFAEGEQIASKRRYLSSAMLPNLFGI